MDKMKRAWAEAKIRFAGGVNSPVRAFRAVGGDPLIIERGLGPYVTDLNGRQYVDHCLSWGAVIHGHADEGVTEAVRLQAARGMGFGTCTPGETTLARLIQAAFPGMERLRFTSSGTEAVMSAIRLARGVTGRDRIVKFEGCYHGHSDGLLVKAGSGLATFGTPSSAGVPAEIAGLTTVLPYNDEEAVKDLFRASPGVACVVVEPVAGNMGVVPASPRFLSLLRKLTKADGALLVFDEVITGFRVGYGGAQHVYGVEPDLTALGKIIGGGLPVGAFGGKRSFMEQLSPLGPVYQAGTLSGNPVSMAAGAAALERLDKAFYSGLNARAASFVKAAKKAARGVSIVSFGSMFTPFFSGRSPKNFAEAARQDTKRFARFFRSALAGGVYFPPSAFEASFLSESHGECELARSLEALKKC